MLNKNTVTFQSHCGSLTVGSGSQGVVQIVDPDPDC